MTWELIEPTAGDMIRVKSGQLWHYGIYASDGEVIQFGPTPTPENILDRGNVAVIATDIDAFLLGGFLEVAVPDKKEAKTRRKPQQVLETARSRLGQTGYHILHNNCEHFAYECMFGRHTCEQVDKVREAFRNFPVLEVYVTRIPEDCKIKKVKPKTRQKEIEACTHDRVKQEKYGVWKLLSYGVNRSFGKKLEDLSLEKQENGQWTCPDFQFSLSHSSGMAAVALSRKPVGVDVEAIDRFRVNGLQNKILSQEELEAFGKVESSAQAEFLAEKWTQKESRFKCQGGINFHPARVDTQNTRVTRLEAEGKTFFLAVASEDLPRLRIHQVVFADLEK